MLIIIEFGRRIVLRVLLILVATSALVCFAPGFDLDERQLDIRLDSTTVAAMRKARSETRNPLASSLKYVSQLIRADLGYSSTFNRQVSELLAERLSTTARTIVGGLFLGWVFGG